VFGGTADEPGPDLVVDAYTQAANGRVIVTAAIYADVAVRRPQVFAFSKIDPLAGRAYKRDLWAATADAGLAGPKQTLHLRRRFMRRAPAFRYSLFRSEADTNSSRQPIHSRLYPFPNGIAKPADDRMMSAANRKNESRRFCRLIPSRRARDTPAWSFALPPDRFAFPESLARKDASKRPKKRLNRREREPVTDFPPPDCLSGQGLRPKVL
jgi:hypothetical protein